jgi:hypothetical protein
VKEKSNTEQSRRDTETGRQKQVRKMFQTTLFEDLNSKVHEATNLDLNYMNQYILLFLSEFNYLLLIPKMSQNIP